MPVNQEDPGTALSFVVPVFESLERVGVPIEPADRKAYTACWCAIGHARPPPGGGLPGEAEVDQRVEVEVLNIELGQAQALRLGPDEVVVIVKGAKGSPRHNPLASAEWRRDSRW